MKRFNLILLRSVIIIVVAVVLINFYFAHKTRYLNLAFYRISSGIVEVAASRMEVMAGIKLKGYQNTNSYTITDKEVIKKVVDYLNSIPLVSVHSYFDKSRRVHIIPALSKLGYNFITGAGGDERSGTLRFYDDEGHEMGSVNIYNEEYISSMNYQAFKVRDKGTLIISGLEALDIG